MKKFKDFLEEADKPRPHPSYIKKLGMQASSWAGFKHHLVKIGVLKTVDHDTPEECKIAYAKRWGRTLHK